MNVEYRKIEEAYEFVSAGEVFAHSALLDTATGAVLLQTESGELDEFPAEIDRDRYLPIPNRIELQLGKRLVIAFVAAHLPAALTEVREMFGSRGAYTRFKELLAVNNLFDAWYEYEGKETERALREWCAGAGITLEG
jgi:hypothetical protein